MEQLQALKELAEKVEAGDSFKLIPLGKASFGPDLPQDHLVEKSFDGSLDAAHSLHKAVLGDRWETCLVVCSTPFVNLTSDTGESVASIISPPARAWLLAIIKAKIAELDG